jgi:protease-4
VIYLGGAIVRGDGGWLGGDEVGADAIVRALEDATEDEHIRAVVLRIDSPGGSSFASDEIWRATQRLRDAGKPLVVSMGGVAASGGYYVAAGADAIWAEPMTITGSIGVFSGHLSPDPLFDRIGVQTTTLTRGRHAALLSTERWDDARREEMQQMVDTTYAQFKERVGEGRQLEPEAVEALARGRVWSGQSALSRGLVDRLGGLPEALADARTRAGLDDRPVATVSLNGGAGPWLPFRADQMLSAHLPIVAQIHTWLEPTGPAWTLATHPEERAWLMMPWTLDVAPQ